MKKLQKVIILGDPGLDGATALSLALADPNLEVLAALACAGNVSAEQATRNMQAVLARLDPDGRGWGWPQLLITMLTADSGTGPTGWLDWNCQAPPH
jgi:inosine-uridine nucleoside N-ribohydrolase